MNGNNQDDPSDSESDGEGTSLGAQSLFGHKGGAKPWEQPSTQEAAPSPPPKPQAPRSSSAPYPRDAQYAPRNEIEPESGALFSDVDDETELTKLHPNYKLLMRATAIIWALILMFVATIADFALQSGTGIFAGVIMIPALLLALFLVIRVPGTRFNARGYQISHDRLRVVRGVMWHSDTIVPFGRVQHIDVDQGPIERALGIATLTLHTAGSHNASVRLPGLGHALATEMREAIRAHIKQESM